MIGPASFPEDTNPGAAGACGGDAPATVMDIPASAAKVPTVTYCANPRIRFPPTAAATALPASCLRRIEVRISWTPESDCRGSRPGLRHRAQGIGLGPGAWLLSRKL